MIAYDSLQELADRAQKADLRISDIVLANQCQELETTSDVLIEKMIKNAEVMKNSILGGLQPNLRSSSGLSGGDAYKVEMALQHSISIGGTVFTKVLRNALAVSEYNACMGEIVAAPTAGSCGIIPAVLLTVVEERGIEKVDLIMSLFTAAGIGLVIAKKASISGAEGGCQAECGSASAMAAGALVEMLGGSPQMVVDASAIALKNVLGLVCDPVAGFVEIPCIKRNVMGAVNALSAAELALAGVTSVIPADEVIGAMKTVGDMMSSALKETAEGGLAATPTGQRLAKMLLCNQII